MEEDVHAPIAVDLDAVAGWIGSYGGAASPSYTQCGVWAGEVGAPRLLKPFERRGPKTSRFIPGHSIETFPNQVRMVAEAGHEVGAHGYLHENPISMTPAQDEVLSRSIELVEKLSGRAPRGYVAPWWKMSAVTADLLLKYGFAYDHGHAYLGFVPFYARSGDKWA
jgi:peptidoglycan/xylan/chitin deacetylase (PgdA/CDA1 family)